MAIFFFHFFFFAFGGGGSVSHRFFSPAWEIVENPVCKIETARNFNTNFNSQKRCWPISSLHVDIHVRLITISDLLIYLTRSFSKVKLSSFRWGREGGGAPPPSPRPHICLRVCEGRKKTCHVTQDTSSTNEFTVNTSRACDPFRSRSCAISIKPSNATNEISNK